MKKLLAMAMAVAFLLMSSPGAYPQAKQTIKSPPPVAPTLVREGDFAARLASGLEMGTIENETEAEALLASAGVAPKNGWISDYPVTPDILGELHDAVADAADSNRLPMGRYEALAVLENLSAELGLYVLADTSEEYGEASAPACPQYTEPTVINNYYYREGPPVITYYPPPSDYLYLYAWVPYPFWYSRFFFSGFFILHDFHKVSFVRNRIVVVTNHVFHRRHRRFFKIDPAKRRGGRSLRGEVNSSHGRLLTRAAAQRGARTILQRSHDRMASQRIPVNRNVPILKSPGGFIGWTRNEISQQKRTFTGPTGVRAQKSPPQEVQRARRDPAKSFTALGRNEKKALGQPFAPGRHSSLPSRNIKNFHDFSGIRAQTSLQQNVQRARRDSASFLKVPGGSKARSSSPASVEARGFSGGLGKGSKGFSGKVSSNLPGGSALKGASKLPF
ncbi:MAG: hypothetical protein LJE89_14175 [Deltaproteobacteria bacterium]|nr:hypothetical protein [Deltaproteobacteria bacterium]